MGRNAMDDENRLLSNEEDDDDQEEALSLSDLPIHVEEVGLPTMNIQLPDDDFDFGSVTTEPEMCAADDVFFRGRILPLRHSVSSDSGLALLRADESRPVTLYRSGSIDNNYQSHKTTIIRSSSSNRSQYSSSCSSSRSSSTRTNNSTSIPKLPKPNRNPKPSNPFQHYSHRRPVPGSLNRASSSNSRYVNVIGQGQTMKSNNNNMWSIFRLGLVRTPTMEPLDTKFHGSNNNNRNMFINQGKEKEKKKNEEQKFRYFGGGCKCSVETVVVPCRITASEKGTKEKTKRDMSRRHRMYEWLKELSVADDDDEEEEAENGRGNLGKVDSKLAARNKIIIG